MIPSGPELMVVVFVIILLFGAKKLPELARGLGQGIREFRDGLTGSQEDKAEEKQAPADKEAKDEQDDATS